MSEPIPRTAEEAVDLFLRARQRGERLDPARFATEHAHLGPELAEALEALIVIDRAASEVTSAEYSSVSRIGPYRVVREIGRGGMGVVFEAIEEPLGRRVALKVLPPELVSSSSARARFRREAELAARLDHSGVATVYGAGVENERPWIAMRFVDGISLSRAIRAAQDTGHSCVRVPSTKSGERSAVFELAACLARVARALHFAHEQGVVHRDVKPSNIMLGQDGMPMLVDFGLAIPEDSSGYSVTKTGETAGTPAYMAPELLAGEVVRSDVQCDVYALGVTLYEALALRRPFDGATPFALQRAILTGTPTELRVLNRAVVRDLAIVVATALERDRERRYRNAALLADDLEAVAGGRAIRARPVPLTGRIMRWTRRQPLQAALASLLFVSTIVAAIAGGSWWSGRATVLAAEGVQQEKRFESALQDGYYALAQHKISEADRAFDAALVLRPHDREALAGRALVALKDERRERAREILAGLDDSPAFAALRALAEERVPDVEFSPEWFANASSLELFVDGLRFTRQREEAPLSSGRALGTQAFKRFDEAVRRSSAARFYHHVARAQAAYWTKDEDAIRSSAASLTVLWPNQARALFTAGYALTAIDREASMRLLERAVELDPKWGPPHQVLANEYYRQRRLDDALLHVQAALAADPRDADAYNTLGMIRRRQGCLTEARDAVWRAVCLRPNSVQFTGHLAMLDASDTPDASVEVLFRQALAADAFDVGLRLEFGMVLLNWRRLDEARYELDTVVGLDPTNVRGWQCSAVNHHNARRFEEGLAAIDQALELAPGVPELVNFKNMVLGKRVPRSSKD